MKVFKLSISVICFFALILSTSVLLHSCAGEDTTGVTDDEIVIGSWGPLEGPAALWGSVVRGMDAYFQMINDEGGIHGRDIKFVYRNDGYEPPRTVSAVRQMVQNDNVFMFVGGIGTAPGMAVKDYITSRNIPWVAPASGSTQWAFPPNENLFGVYPLYVEEAAVQIQYAVEELGLSKFAIIYQNDDYGKGGLIGAEMALEEYGLEFAAKVSTQIMDTDLSSHAARLRESGAEAVLMWVLPRQAAIIKGNTAVMGYRPQWIASSTLSDNTLMYDITDGLWEGVLFSTFGDFFSDNPLLSKYVEAIQKYQPDVRPGVFALAGFLFAEPVVEALERAGPELTREAFIEAMESLQGFQGIGAEITFGPNIRQGTRSTGLVRSVGPDEIELVMDMREAEIDVQEAIRRLGL